MFSLHLKYNMKSSIFALISLSSFVLMSASCKKKDNCTAGTDGTLTVAIFPQHHGKAIPNREDYRDTVYLKFCTQEQMALDANKVPTDYDAVFIGEGDEDHVHIEGLSPGDYYIFINAYDTTGPYRVFGGIPFSTEQTSGEVDLNVPVSEVQ